MTKNITKKLLAGVMLGAALVSSPASSLLPNTVATVEAASAKNPYIQSVSYNDSGTVDFGVCSGHKPTSVQIDGKDKTGQVKKLGCTMIVNGVTFDIYEVKAGYGYHRVDVKDNKGYWTINYQNVLRPNNGIVIWKDVK